MPFSWDLDTRPVADANGARPARFSLRQVDDDTVYRASEYVIGVRYVFRRRPSDTPSEAQAATVRQAIDTAHADH
jgi:hypothetical protein